MDVDVALKTDDADWDDAAAWALRREVRRLKVALVRRRIGEAGLAVSCRARADGRSELCLELEIDGRRGAVVERTVTDVLLALPGAFDALLAEAPTGQRDDASEVAARAWPALRAYARQQVALAEAERLLPTTTVNADDLTDAVVLAVLPTLEPGATFDDALARMRSAVDRHIDLAMAEATTLHETFRSLDEPDPGPSAPLDDEPEDEVAPTFADHLGNEVAPDALAVAEDHEARARLVRALFRLEPRTRRDYAEVAVDGWPVDVAAAAQGRSAQSLGRDLRRSRAFLARALRVPEHRVDALYAALGERYRGEERSLERG